ncbi:MAG TPA: MFS transporter [Rhodanobacteraceae bacterium]|nr:MFS transporter [Rhodanobacteraceae bacterium]
MPRPLAIRRQHPAGVPPVARRELWAWAMYDFANSGYTTVVITAVFNAYFVAVVAGGASWGTLAWTAALSLSYALVVISAPLLGAWADLRARKKTLLVATSVVCIVGTAALAACGRGEVALAVCLVVITNTAYGTGENLIAAFLPELADRQAMGRLSGYGWALGYGGGLLVLALCLAWIQGAAARGAGTNAAVAETMLITAAVFLLAALPTFLLLRERARPQPADGVLRLAWDRVRSALSGSHGLRDLQRFMLCIVCYQAGVATVIAIAAIYTQQALGFTTAQSIRLILVVNVAAAVGALAFGRVEDRLGHRATLAVALLGWLLAIALLWVSQSVVAVWLAANLAGLCMGASQSSGRALVGYLCPHGREAEVFGLWGLAVKLSSIIGPLGYGLIEWLSGGNHRAALLATGAYFVLGLVLLARVDVRRGHALAATA